ncbi:MAG: hypothetical protein NVS9B10_09880 [Nevskia sp.]
MIAAAVALLSSASASALELNAGDYKFTVNGNINVHYIYSDCDKNPVAVAGGLACGKSGSERSNSSVSNGLLPAALVFGITTNQSGLDIGAHFGFYPGVSSNDGGSPNLQQGAPAGTNVALSTTALDVRQVYLDFGNKDVGTFTLGRNFGLFGFDAIINDITIPGVGGAGAASGGAPANTTLGSIGLGYVYTDTLAQINYTAPEFVPGLKLTLGIYDPLNPIGQAGAKHDQPGFHGKAAYTLKFDAATKLYLSSAFITQEQRDVGALGNNYRSYAADFGGKFTIADFEVLGWYYYGKGLGTTALYLLSDDGAGHRRGSNGYLAQATYKFGDLKLGVNYGTSRLGYANAADQRANRTLVASNSKITGGAYYSLTKNLTLVGEVTSIEAKAHNGGKNEALNFNIGTFLSF